MRMKDKVALVTGAASGIGREIALAYGREGARVAVADLNLDGAKAVAAEIERAGSRAAALAMDVTDEAQVDGGVDRTVRDLGGLHVLVSNAGIQHIDPVDTLAYSDWRRVVTIQLDGAFLTTRAALRPGRATARPRGTSAPTPSGRLRRYRTVRLRSGGSAT